MSVNEAKTICCMTSSVHEIEDLASRVYLGCHSCSAKFTRPRKPRSAWGSQATALDSRKVARYLGHCLKRFSVPRHVSFGKVLYDKYHHIGAQNNPY